MDDDILEARKSWVDKMVAWQKEHISDRQMTLILAFVIGVLASVAGYFLHGIVHEIQILLTSGFVKNTYNLLFLLFPIVGIYLTSLFIKYVVRDNISHGITRVLYAISTKNSKLRGHNCWSSVVASGITIGFGGSVGAEAPIVHRFGHRFQSGTDLPHGQEDDDPAGGLRSQCCHCRNLQGTYSRTGLHARGADGRPVDGFASAHPHLVCHSYLFHLYSDGL